MFQTLRPSSTVYILHRDGVPRLEKGSLVSVSTPMPKFPTAPLFGQQQDMVVDLVVRVNNQDITYQKVPASLDVADFGTTNVVLADSRDVMNAEVLGMKQRSSDIISSVELHKGIVDGCNQILSELNPEFAERQAQQDEIRSLKEQMAKLMEMNQTMMNKLSGREASSFQNKDKCVDGK